MFKDKKEAHEWLDSTRGVSWTDTRASELTEKLNKYEYYHRYKGATDFGTFPLWCESREIFVKVMDACVAIGYGEFKPSKSFRQEADGQLLMF